MIVVIISDIRIIVIERKISSLWFGNGELFVSIIGSVRILVRVIEFFIFVSVMMVRILKCGWMVMVLF